MDTELHLPRHLGPQSASRRPAKQTLLPLPRPRVGWRQRDSFCLNMELVWVGTLPQPYAEKMRVPWDQQLPRACLCAQRILSFQRRAGAANNSHGNKSDGRYGSRHGSDKLRGPSFLYHNPHLCGRCSHHLTFPLRLREGSLWLQGAKQYQPGFRPPWTSSSGDLDIQTKPWADSPSGEILLSDSTPKSHITPIFRNWDGGGRVTSGLQGGLQAESYE